MHVSMLLLVLFSMYVHTGAYHRDTSCDASTFIANQPPQTAEPRPGVPAATQVQEGAEGDEKDTEAYKMKRAQFSLQVKLDFGLVGWSILFLIWRVVTTDT